jgi:hypothetical protein
VSAGQIVTEYEDRPGTVYQTQRPAVAILPDGRRIRLGDRVTGSYTRENDVYGAVIGWDAELFVISFGSGSIELRPQDILTIEAAR